MNEKIDEIRQRFKDIIGNMRGMIFLKEILTDITDEILKLYSSHTGPIFRSYTFDERLNHTCDDVIGHKTIVHDMGTKNVIVQVLDKDGVQIHPVIQIADENTIAITMTEPSKITVNILFSK